MNGVRSRTITAVLVVLSLFIGGPLHAAERVPNDTYFDAQWYLRHIGATEAWNRSLGFEGVTVAVIDSGVDIDHPDLKDNIWRNMRETAGDGVDNDGNGYVDDVHGWDFTAEDNDPRPDVSGDFNLVGANHGTIGAGIIAGRGDNGKGIVGVTWQTTIMPLRALDSNGSGDPQQIVRAVEYAVHNGAKVINLSFAGTSRNELLAIALRRAYDAGVFVVAAAGNAPDGGDAVDLDARPLYPVCLDADSSENFVYGVAATDDGDAKAPFSNYGAGCIDVSAPGTRFLAAQLYRPADPRFAQPYGGYYNGTSVAAPVVSGVVALLRALDYNLTPKQIANILTESSFRIDATNPGYFGKLGRGRIDAAKAVERVLSMRRAAPVPTVATASLLTSSPSGGTRLLATAPGPGRRPEIRLFTEDGLFVRSFDAFSESFRGGVSLAIGDFDGNGRRSIVAGAMGSGGPHVRIFDINTRPIGGFFAYDEKFRGGVDVATGDLDGDGKDEIVTGAGPGGGPHVRIFTAAARASGGFFAFEADYKGGIGVATGDLDGDGKDEIVVSATGGAGVRVFDGRGNLKSEILPFGARYRRGMDVSVRDLDGDGKGEIAVARVDKGKETVSFYRADGGAMGEADLAAASLAVLSGGAPGAQTAARDALRFGSGASMAPYVSAFGGGAAAVRFPAYEPRFKGGVNVAAVE